MNPFSSSLSALDHLKSQSPDSLPHVHIYTDGACSRNPGPGGWGAVLICDGFESDLSGGEPQTTNNRMEMMAAVESLKALPLRCRVTLHTDSMYLKDGITLWMQNWKRNGWRTAEKKPVKNRDIWEELDGLLSQHQIEWKWIKGHAGHPENERADALARSGIIKLQVNVG